MAASDTEFPLFRKLPTANQSTTNFTARLGQHLLSFFASLVSLPVNLSGTRDYSTTQLDAKATQLYHTYPYVHLNHSQWAAARNILTLKKSGLPLVAGGADPATGRATQPSALLVSPSLLLVSGDSQRTGRRGTPLPLDLSLHKCGLGKHEKLVLSRNRGWDASGYKTSSWTQTDNLSSFCLSVPKDLGIFERMLRPRLTIRCICDGH